MTLNMNEELEKLRPMFIYDEEKAVLKLFRHEGKMKFEDFIKLLKDNVLNEKLMNG